MPGCSAPNCSNSTVKGYLMKIFPQDAQRRAIWVTNVWGKNRILQKEHRLCEVHFAPEMWETKRLDGKRKLVHNAVPTLFWQYVKNAAVPGGIEKVLVDIRPVEAVDESIVEPQNEELAETHAIMEDCEDIGDNRQVCNALQQDASEVIEALEPCNDNDMFCKIECNRNCQEEINFQDTAGSASSDAASKEIARLQRQVLAYKRKWKQCEWKLQKERHDIGNPYKTILLKIFTPDQIQALRNKSKSVKKWSNESIEKALKLKLTCGTSGYFELKKQGIPLPELRTLHRKLEGFKFHSDEMSITPGQVYDNSSQSYVGKVTLPAHEDFD